MPGCKGSGTERILQPHRFGPWLSPSEPGHGQRGGWALRFLTRRLLTASSLSPRQGLPDSHDTEGGIGSLPDPHVNLHIKYTSICILRNNLHKGSILICTKNKHKAAIKAAIPGWTCADPLRGWGGGARCSSWHHHGNCLNLAARSWAHGGSREDGGTGQRGVSEPLSTLPPQPSTLAGRVLIPGAIQPEGDVTPAPVMPSCALLPPTQTMPHGPSVGPDMDRRRPRGPASAPRTAALLPPPHGHAVPPSPDSTWLPSHPCHVPIPVPSGHCLAPLRGMLPPSPPGPPSSDNTAPCAQPQCSVATPGPVRWAPRSTWRGHD